MSKRPKKGFMEEILNLDWEEEQSLPFWDVRLLAEPPHPIDRELTPKSSVLKSPTFKLSGHCKR